MPLLIDGYNVLHAVGLLGGGVGPGGLERARGALLGLLAGSLEAVEAAQTTIVFDAHHAPPGAPTTVSRHGLTVRYAVGYPDADTLIEELIRTDSAPKRLTVVSSDRRIRRAAERRGAVTVDAETWYEQLLARRRGAGRRASRSAGEVAAGASGGASSGKPSTDLSAEEVDYWVAQFSAEPGPDEPTQAERGRDAGSTSAQSDRGPRRAAGGRGSPDSTSD
jgi:predicted RNA-binding protein with PIN domain